MPSKKRQGVTMTATEHDWRHPTRAAIDSLAKRFSLLNDPGMQDWEYQVADRAYRHQRRSGHVELTCKGHSSF
jgi:hypothetical protein